MATFFFLHSGKMKTSDANQGKSPSIIRKRHQVVRTLLGPVIRLLCLLFYPGLTIEKCRDTRPLLVLYNHQTAFDQFFVSLTFRQHVYHIASEDILTHGFISRLMSFLVAPIPIKKQMTDVAAVRNCVNTAKAGGTIAMAPEGNRTFDGRPVYINPAAAKLAKLMRLPIAILRIEGGYGVHPRWSDCRRRGKMRTYVSRVIEPEEYKALSGDELYSLLLKEMHQDESVPGGSYKSRKSAEYMERLFYVCPKCGFTAFESSGRVIRCGKCGLSAEYTDHKELTGPGFPFASVGAFYDAQKAYVNASDPLEHTEQPVFEETASLYKIRSGERRITIRKDCRIRLYGDRIEAFGPDGAALLTLPFAETEVVTVLGRNKLNVYCGEVYQFISGKRFNAVKYMNLFYRFKNVTGGNDHDEFLGL